MSINDKQVITDMFLTKEAFEQYIQRLQEERAKGYGLTVEEYQNAVVSGSIVTSKL